MSGDGKLAAARRVWTGYDQGVRGNPYPHFAALRSAGPVHRVEILHGRTAWVVVGYTEARAALADPRLTLDPTRIPGGDAGSNPLAGTGLDRHLLSLDGPDHARLRALVAGAFTARRVERLRPRIQEITDGLLAGLAGRDRADLLGDLAVPLAVTVICELLGLPPADREVFRGWVMTMTSPAGDSGAVRAAGLDLAGARGDREGALVGGARPSRATQFGPHLVEQRLPLGLPHRVPRRTDPTQAGSASNRNPGVCGGQLATTAS